MVFTLSAKHVSENIFKTSASENRFGRPVKGGKVIRAVQGTEEKAKHKIGR